MFTIKPNKLLKQAVLLMKNYDRRIEYALDQYMLDLAENVMAEVKRRIPREEEFKGLAESLEVVRIRGLSKGVSYAVIANKEKVPLSKVADLEKSEKSFHIVYPMAGVSPEELSDLSKIILSHSPWSVSMVPLGIPKKEIYFVHRAVSEGEFLFVKKNTEEFLTQAIRADMKAVGGKIKSDQPEPEDEDVEGPESMPDFLWSSLRYEFGMNAPSRPHWRVAIDSVYQNSKNLIKGNEKIQGSLYGLLFKDHLKSNTDSFGVMQAVEFEKDMGEFENKLSSLI